MFLLSAAITLKTPIVRAMDEETEVFNLKTSIVRDMDEETEVFNLKTPIVRAMDKRRVVFNLKTSFVRDMDEQTVVLKKLKTLIVRAMDKRRVVVKQNNFDIQFLEFKNLDGIIKNAVNEIPPDKQNGLFNLAKATFIENSVCIDKNSNYKLIFYKLLKCVKAIPDDLQPEDKQKILTAFLFTVLDPSIQPEYQTSEYQTSEYQTSEYQTSEYQTSEYQTLEYQISEFINKSLQDLERNATFEILIGNPKFSDDPITSLKNLLRDKPETNVNTKNDNNHETPLHVVSRRGKTDIVKILLEHDANVDPGPTHENKLGANCY